MLYDHLLVIFLHAFEASFNSCQCQFGNINHDWCQHQIKFRGHDIVYGHFVRVKIPPHGVCDFDTLTAVRDVCNMSQGRGVAISLNVNMQ